MWVRDHKGCLRILVTALDTMVLVLCGKTSELIYQNLPSENKTQWIIIMIKSERLGELKGPPIYNDLTLKSLQFINM